MRVLRAIQRTWENGFLVKPVLKFIERGRKGYCYEDLWSFDYWLSGMIARGLREFKGRTLSYPSDVGDWDVWMSILDEMIDCFEEQRRNTDNWLYKGGFDSWTEFQKKREEKLHRGLELLGKYYYNLWE